MAVQNHGGSSVFVAKSVSPAILAPPPSTQVLTIKTGQSGGNVGNGGRGKVIRLACALGGSSNSSGNTNNGERGMNANYVVPLNKSFSSFNSSFITRPLVEILRDLNKKIPDNIIKLPYGTPSTAGGGAFIPWHQANRMLSFYAPGWCGEVRHVIFSENGSVTVVYRLTIRGSDGEAHRESTGTVSSSNSNIEDPVAAAEEIAFCRACARFGLGLYLYHEK